MDRAFNPVLPTRNPPVLSIHLCEKWKSNNGAFCPANTPTPTKEHPRDLRSFPFLFSLLLFFLSFFFFFFKILRELSQQRDVSMNFQATHDVSILTFRRSFRRLTFDRRRKLIRRRGVPGCDRVPIEGTRERVRGTGRPRAGSDDSKGKMIASPGSLVLVDWAIAAARVVNQGTGRLEWRDSTIRVHWKRTRHEVISTLIEHCFPSIHGASFFFFFLFYLHLWNFVEKINELLLDCI